MGANNKKKIAIYGLSTETERLLPELAASYDILCLLDGFRTDGMLYGVPIWSLDEAIDRGISGIIVVARPGSCKAIVNRIGEDCRGAGVAVSDIRGRDLLERQSASFSFPESIMEDYRSRDELVNAIEAAEIVSFDLFDTLIMRRVFSYSDIWDMLECRLVSDGIDIPDFVKFRTAVEKEMSREVSPRLVRMYEELLSRCGCNTITAEELAQIEWDMDYDMIIPRGSMCAIFREAVRHGKKVIITSDTYYSRKQIESILEKVGLDGYAEVFVSCEFGYFKSQGLFKQVEDYRGTVGPEKVLHVGNDDRSDVVVAEQYGFKTFKVNADYDFYDALGGLGLDEHMQSLGDRMRVGLLKSILFNDPFLPEQNEGKLSVSEPEDIGYLFCAPVISDFVMWLRDRVQDSHIGELLFLARDGYLPQRLYEILDDTISHYFVTSRTAAIRAGMETAEDIAYVDSMKYSGTDDDYMRVRFGIEPEELVERDRDTVIFERAALRRANYRSYIESLGLGDGQLAVFDFVAKGTTQMYLEHIMGRPTKGFYFLQLEPEFMADKGLDIEAFYTEAERKSSAIFENYYILETILTAPYPSVDEFNGGGLPVYATETRSPDEITCIERIQDGITTYFEELQGLLDCTQKRPKINKKLDEAILSLITHIRIEDATFTNMMVEDPFFGRMTRVGDLLE